MSNVPEKLKYTTTHEWVDVENQDVITVGLTDHAQHMLGEFVFFELPEVGAEYEKGVECCVAESVKAAADVFAPVEGEIVEINEELLESPGKVNEDPYGDGWLFRFQPSDPQTLESLMDKAAYEAFLESEK